MQTRTHRLPLKIIVPITTLLVMTIFSPILYAAPPVMLTDEMKNYPLGLHMDILEDPTKKLGIEQVRSENFSGKFIQSPVESPGFGFTSSSYWVRFTLKNPTRRDIHLFIEAGNPVLDHVDLYFPRAKGGYLVKHTGDHTSFKNRDVDYRNFLFSMTLKADDAATCYMRFESTSSMNLSLSLWTPASFISKVSSEEMILGLFYGIILAMIIYSLFIFMSVKDMSYVYYVLFILPYSLYLFIINGFAFQYFWPESIWWANTVQPVTIAFTLFWALQFTRTFLATRKFSPAIDRIFIAFMIVSILALGMSIFTPYAVSIRGVTLLALSGGILQIIVTLICLIKGMQAVRLFFIAWTALIAGITIEGLRAFGVLPNNFITVWSSQTGVVLQVVLIGFALADRINIMKRELEKLNTSLEELVEDRAKDLNAVLFEMTERDTAIQQELDLAATIQKGFLPRTPLRYNGLNIVAYYKSMSKIGGDFYDIFPMKGGHIGVLIADVSGHGIPAAFVTAMVKISFHEATQRYLFPRDIFISVNNEMMKSMKTGEYFTAFLTVISPSYEIYYSNASHPKAVLVRMRTREVETWDTNGLFIGAVLEANDRYEEKLDFLDFGDRLCLYTDGLAEARNRAGEDFGEERLNELLLSTMDLPVDDAKSEIVNKLEAFIGDSLVRDDISFVLLEVDPAYQRFLELRNKGFELLYKNEISEAISELETALEIDDRDAKAHSLLGKCYFKDGNFAKAADHLSKYLSYNAEDADGWFQLANSLYNVKKYKEALHASQQACQLRPNYKNAMVILGMTYKKLGKLKDARSVWEKILFLDSAHAVARAEIQAFTADE